MPGEEAPGKVGAKKAAKTSLIIGGAALATNKGKSKAKIEDVGDAAADEQAWAWLFKSAPNKSAAHLLR